MSGGLLVKFVDGGHVVGFDEGTVAARTGEFVASGCVVVVALAVRGCGELFE